VWITKSIRKENIMSKYEVTEADIIRFKSKIAILDEDSCWLWTASCDENGYGRFAFGPKATVRKVQASRFAYTVFNGVEVEKEFVVRHTCDNPSCCNPKHLILGTHQDNMNDMKERGRSAISFGRAVLTWEIIDAIRSSSLTGKELASKYGVSRGNISMIVNNKIWKEEHREVGIIPKDLRSTTA